MGVNRYKGTCSSNAALVNKYVGTAYDHVKTVSDNIEDVKTVADALGDDFPDEGLDTLVNNIDDIVTNAENISDINTVAGIKDEVVTVADIEQEIIDVPSYTAQAIDAANAAEEDADRAETEADRATEQADLAANIADPYKGLWPDVGGSASKGDVFQTQVGGVGTGQYFTALQNTTVDPIGDDVNWREVISADSLSEYTDLSYDDVDSMLNGTPIAAAVGDFCSTPGSSWKRVSALSMDLSDFIPLTPVTCDLPSGSDITQWLEDQSNHSRVRVHLRFIDGYIYFINNAVTRFTESIIEMGTCTFRPVTEGVQMWTNSGQRNKWYNGKFEPLDQSKSYYGVLWTHDSTQPNGSFNEWFNPYFAGIFRGITALMDSSLGSACYSHAIHNPSMTGVGKSRAGSWNICFNGDQAGNTAGNDSRVVGGRVSSSESNLYNIGGVSTRFDKVRSDGAKYSYRLNGGQYNQITGQYSEFNDVLLKIEGSCYGNQMVAGSQASNAVIQDGQQVNNLPVISIGINGIPDVLSLSARYESGNPGNFVLSAASNLKLGLYNGIDNTLVSSVDIKKIDASTLGLSTQSMTEDVFKIQAESGHTIAIGGPSGLDARFDDNGNIDMLAGRRLKGGVQYEERASLRPAGYEGSYLLNESGTYSLICHTGGVRVKFSGTVV